MVFFQCLLLYFVFLKDRTAWYKRQLFRYAAFGIILTILHLITIVDVLESFHAFDFVFFKNILNEVDRKGFFALAFLGAVIAILKSLNRKIVFFKELQIEKLSLKIFLYSYAVFVLFSLVWDKYLITGFGLMWSLAFLSLIPIEFIFQSLTRLRSKRNLIYVVYILICLLDSHFEGRIKLFIKIFNSSF